MHKIFAKPTFLGKKIVFLTQCHSTNDEMSSLLKQQNIPEGTVIYSDHQLRGKGQRGNRWEAAPGKNILLSVLLRPRGLAIRSQHYLNLVAGLAVVDLLKNTLKSTDLKLKWPNDVYIGNKKVAGILIENNLKGGSIDTAIVGIGLNVNQVENLPVGATSLRKEMEGSVSELDRFECMDGLVQLLEKWYLKLTSGALEEIRDRYLDLLYWKNEPHTFKHANAEFKGTITGITENGRLVVQSQDGQLVFDVKEILFVQ